MPDPGSKASIRLAATATKGLEARIFPFGEAADVVALLLARWFGADGVRVFHRGGQRIYAIESAFSAMVKDFRSAWDNACKRAGLEGRIPHDLRRGTVCDALVSLKGRL